MFYRLIFVHIFLFTFFFIKLSAQEPELTTDELSQYKNQSVQLLHYLEDTFNFLGDTTQPVSEKEIIINQSYLKIFRNDKVQIEDDLVANRQIPVNKDVQAYLKDIMFFYKTVHFVFTINNIEQYVNDSGKIYFKIIFNRRLQGITISGDTVDNNRIRYMEINLNIAEKDLKIASIYTTKLDEKENLMHWWNSMNQEWKNYFGKSILVYDTLPLAMIQSFTDSSIVTPVWKTITKTDTLILNDTTFGKTSNISHYLFEKLPDTINANTSMIFNILNKLKNRKTVIISNNLTINNIRPLAEMNKLEKIDISNTLIDNLNPLHNLGKLEILNISGTAVSDLTPLRFVWNLKKINFSNTQIFSLKPLSGLKNLENVNGDNCVINSLAPLSYHQNLKVIQMSGCKITEIDSLINLSSLTRLDLHSNNIVTIDSIGHFLALQQLNLDSTLIKSVKPLSNLKFLTVLQINNTAVSDLMPLINLPDLKIIYCDNSGVNKSEAINFMQKKPECSVIFNSEKLESWWHNLSPEWRAVFKPFINNEYSPGKESLHTLIHLTKLDISGHKEINNLQPLTILYQLEVLNIEGTSVSSLKPLSQLTQLSYLNFSHTNITDISPLKNIKYLRNIHFSNTNVNNLQPLFNSKYLKTVYCDNTGVNKKDVAMLLDVLPNCIVVFETRSLRFWWNNQPENWQEIFEKIGDFNENPTTEQLHGLIERKELSIKNLPREAGLEELNVFFMLRSLTIDNSQIVNISPLADLPALQILHISNGPLSDITGIESLKNLTTLVLKNTAVDDINLLSELNRLKMLDVSGTKVKSLKPLQKLTGIEQLIINNTRVKTLKYIMGFQHLKILKCYNTPLRTKKVDAFKNAHPETEVVFY